MKNTRRSFIAQCSSAATLIAVGGGGFQHLWGASLLELQSRVKNRFIVASDAHYGQPDTAFKDMAITFVSKANAFHDKLSCDFCVLNGDIIHDNPKFMPKAKRVFSRLDMPLYVTQGNHDRVTETEWVRIWDMPLNHSFVVGNYKMILVTTSNIAGDYLEPDLDWLEQELEQSENLKVLLFVHIPQKSWTKHAIDSKAFFALLKRFSNVKACFHGHEHKEDGLYMEQNIPFVFDSHIGGSWGTDYKGFRVVEILDDDSLVTYMMNPDIEISRDIL